jgi:hypothetical protein
MLHGRATANAGSLCHNPFRSKSLSQMKAATSKKMKPPRLTGLAKEQLESGTAYVIGLARKHDTAHPRRHNVSVRGDSSSMHCYSCCHVVATYTSALFLATLRIVGVPRILPLYMLTRSYNHFAVLARKYRQAGSKVLLC